MDKIAAAAAPTMPTIETTNVQRCHGGTQGFYRAHSDACGGPMRFAVFEPPQARERRVPVLYFLAGLTCTEETATIKAGAQRVAAEVGLMLVMPDTSPRDTGIAGATGDWEFGEAAGFYLDATEAPWSARFRMETHVVRELPAWIESRFAAEPGNRGITGHSMGGHGALTIALRNPARFRSVSAFAPIVSPLNCPWGEKALTGYIGADKAAWREYDACALIDDGARLPDLLVDQGTGDNFLAEQLKTHLLQEAVDRAGMPATIRMQPGYDHSYYFISTFMAEHIAWHAKRLRAD
jgi:S-formylglutathione hydrolase